MRDLLGMADLSISANFEIINHRRKNLAKSYLGPEQLQTVNILHLLPLFHSRPEAFVEEVAGVRTD